jgi:hypothetical protein
MGSCGAAGSGQVGYMNKFQASIQTDITLPPVYEVSVG